MTAYRLLMTCVLVLFGLAACTPPAETVSVTRPMVPATIATASATPPPIPTNTTTSPTIAATEAAVRPIEPDVETVTPRPPRPAPNPTSAAPPSISPEALAQRVENGLSFTAVPGIEGFPLRLLSGFEYGFRYSNYCKFGPYHWLTDEQLMLYPTVAYTSWFEGPTFGQSTQPIVFNLTDGTGWLPEIPHTDVCNLPVWSESRQQLIEASEGEVRLRDLAGNVMETYPGSMPLFIAPSGQRLLAGQNWIDLTTGEVVSLTGWQRVKFPRRPGPTMKGKFLNVALATSMPPLTSLGHRLNSPAFL